MAGPLGRRPDWESAHPCQRVSASGSATGSPGLPAGHLVATSACRCLNAEVTKRMTTEQAAADLVRARQSAEQVRARAQWSARYLGVFAAGFAAITLILGLMHPFWLRMSVWGAVWGVLVVGMVAWARSQPAHPEGSRRWRSAWAWAGTGVLYGVTLWVGDPAQLGRMTYWVPAAVLVALPLAAAAWRERQV